MTYHNPHTMPRNPSNKVLSQYGWIRERDCYYAEKIGYKWFPLNKPLTDFGGRLFTHILCTSGYLTHVLEPDTRVPNFSTNAHDALQLLEKMGADMKPYLKQFLAEANAMIAKQHAGGASDD